MQTPFTGLCITPHAMSVYQAGLTFEQLHGEGSVYNLNLVTPGHMKHYGRAVSSLEVVTVAPHGRVGEHLQGTDEIYYLLSGKGCLQTNGTQEGVVAGDLVIAPRGTLHSIHNTESTVPLTFFVTEVAAPQGERRPATVLTSLPDHLREGTFHQTSKPVRLLQVDLSALFAGAWGLFTLLELPAGARLHPYLEQAYDQNVLVPFGNATLTVEGLEERFGTDNFGINAFLPRGVKIALTNQSSRDPLLVVILSFPFTTAGEV
ncbi:hypothetical protein KSF_109260 [Reticulibacter mediterranei]|uniref:Cupin type-2 domain-containing protein n=1 Tax=Reticulibacter mediterranei TaxID=2778369 RepID=A0A8J3IUJ1_9CHLR|nr:cupin domain-containing protein [Reticulibacter mediterranei]GHP00879.1 hypothetical protein KSF_109260 [Reticulibacter mediterranei]